MLPFLASLIISSTTAAGVMVVHFGGFLLKGRADPEIPLP